MQNHCFRRVGSSWRSFEATHISSLGWRRLFPDRRRLITWHSVSTVMLDSDICGFIPAFLVSCDPVKLVPVGPLTSLSPGEILPDFPDRTHCKAADLHLFPHLSRFATVNDAIARIPRGFPLHNPNQMQRRNEPPYPADLPLRNCVTTQGSMNCHPSGKRKFTPRELACLQGFPLEHQFGHMRTRKQIGNAVPPIVAKVFFEQVKRALRKADGLA